MFRTSILILFYFINLILVSANAGETNPSVKENPGITVEGERYDLGGRGRILDGVVVIREGHTYTIEISFSQFFRYIWHTPKGSGSSVTIKLEPSLTSRVDSDALSDRAIITPVIEGEFPVKEVMYEGLSSRDLFEEGRDPGTPRDPRERPDTGRDFDNGPFLVITFDRKYAIEVIQNAGFRSLTVQIK